MVGILLPLLGMYVQLGAEQSIRSRQEQWLIEYPINLYAGWISVATVVNSAIGLYSLDWDGWGIAPSVWTVIMMLISGAIAMAVSIRRRDPVLPMVVVWALVAIAFRQWSIPLVAFTAVGLAISVTGLVMFRQFKPYRCVK
jgi:hypothetical protein